MKTSMEKRIWNYQTDSFQIVHHARYLEILEEARWEYCEKNHLIAPFNQRGIHHVIVNVSIDYLDSAVVGDGIRVDTSLHNLSTKSITFRQMVSRGSRTILKAAITNVYIRTADRRVIPVPEMALFWDDIKLLLEKGNIKTT